MYLKPLYFSLKLQEGLLTIRKGLNSPGEGRTAKSYISFHYGTNERVNKGAQYKPMIETWVVWMI